MYGYLTDELKELMWALDNLEVPYTYEYKYDEYHNVIGQILTINATLESDDIPEG